MKIRIEEIKPTDCYDWLLKKHYAKRKTPINKAFGLVMGDYITGVCTFAIPASRFEFSKQPYELNRLVVNEGLGKNILSKFVSICLNGFGEAAIIVSYADENYGHHGYIYQSTNWIYTGRSSAEKRIYVNGNLLEFSHQTNNEFFFELNQEDRRIDSIRILSSTFVPKILGINDDTRKLGLDVAYIYVR